MLTEKQKEAHRRVDKKYKQSKKGKANTVAYRETKAYREVLRKFRQTEKHAAIVKRYGSSIKGCLQVRFQAIKQRCTNKKQRLYYRYGGRGIKVKFKSLDDFRDYVMNELKVDPRGKHIHRIDNDGHYERGNIEFLTSKEHGLKHRKIEEN